VRVQLVLRPGDDDDLIAWVKGQDNRSEAIRQAIREQIAPTGPVGQDALRAILREELGRWAASPGIANRPQTGDVDAQSAALLDSLF